MDARAQSRNQIIEDNVKAYNGVMPTTWGVEEAAEKCKTIIVEKISPIFDSSAFCDGPFSPMFYASFAAGFRSESEPYTCLNRTGAKLVKDAGLRMGAEEMRRKGWKTEILSQSVNLDNVVLAEKGVIRLLKQRKLTYHQCLNELEGGGIPSSYRDLPEGVIFGVYLCYNPGGVGSLSLSILGDFCLDPVVSSKM